MFLQSEDPAVVKTDPLKNSVAIKQAVIEHGNFGIALGIKFPVDVNLRKLRGGTFIDRRFYRFA